MFRALLAGLAAATITYFAMGNTAHAQVMQAPPANNVGRAPGPVITALVPDLQPIPSRIAYGVVSIRNTGTAASAPALVTVDCHLPGQSGGCGPQPSARLMAPYVDPAYPDKVVVHIPAIQPGHVYSHNLTFWNSIAWPTGGYQFDFVTDVANSVNESNEANNAGSFVWNVP